MTVNSSEGSQTLSWWLLLLRRCPASWLPCSSFSTSSLHQWILCLSFLSSTPATHSAMLSDSFHTLISQWSRWVSLFLTVSSWADLPLLVVFQWTWSLVSSQSPLLLRINPDFPPMHILNLSHWADTLTSLISLISSYLVSVSHACLWIRFYWTDSCTRWWVVLFAALPYVYFLLFEWPFARTLTQLELLTYPPFRTWTSCLDCASVFPLY